MHFNRFFQNTPSLVLSLLLITLGTIGVGLAWSAYIRTEAIMLILIGKWGIFLTAVVMLLGGLLLLAYVLKDSRRRYTYIEAGKSSCVLDETFIQQYLDLYWENLFPSQDISYELNIKKNKIRILANFPSLPAEEQKRFLDKQKRELSHIFGRILGYPHKVILGASFSKG